MSCRDAGMSGYRDVEQDGRRKDVRIQECMSARMTGCQIGCKVMVLECQDATRSGCQDAEMPEFTIKCRMSGSKDVRV